MRYFIGLLPPKRVRHSVFESTKHLNRRGFKLVEEEKLHITLKFLGDLNKNELEAVKNALKGVRFNTFKVSVKNKGAFPNTERPRVLWFSFVGKLGGLSKNIKEALNSVHLRPVDNKAFSSHMTIGRIKSFSKRLITDFKRMKVPEVEFLVDRFQLLVTRTDLPGWPYEIVEEYSLKD